MSTACLLTVLTCGASLPPAGCISTAGSLTVVTNVSMPVQLRRERNELRSDYRTLRREADRPHADPFKLTPRLIDLYVELSDPGALPYGERKIKFQALRLRLRKMHNRLLPYVSSENNQTDQPRRRIDDASAPGGAGTLARAGQLIRLIQSTISPDSWDVNGGTNSIRFYAPLNVLVVRASAEVHRQIGGTLPNLK